MHSGTSFARSVIQSRNLSSTRSSFWIELRLTSFPSLSLRTQGSMRRPNNSFSRSFTILSRRPFTTVYTMPIQRVGKRLTLTSWESSQTLLASFSLEHRSIQRLWATGTLPSFRKLTSAERRVRTPVWLITILVRTRKVAEKGSSCATVLLSNVTLFRTTMKPSTTSGNGRCSWPKEMRFKRT